METRIMKGGKRVPVVVFFGTKGGVGKTTISQRFAELVTLAQSAPNVLILDCDVYHRGMTKLLSEHASITCKTVHDYVASKNVSDVEAVDITALIKGVRPDSGSLYFIPASTPEADHVFDESAKIGPEKLLEILYELISKTVQKYDCDCVIMDCTPIIDPYTAAAAMIADRAFIIGQNEPISFGSLRTYPSQIRDFYPEFTTAKMKIIINKVRGWERLEERGQTESFFHAIPFTMDIVDVSEGLKSINAMRIMMFEDHIAQIIEKIFKTDHPELIPNRQEVLPPEWNSLVEKADRLPQASSIKRLGVFRLLLPIGLLIAIAGCILFIGGSSQRYRLERSILQQELVTVLKNEVAKAEASSSQETEMLREALKIAEEADPDNDESVNQAIEFSRKAGLEVERSIPLQELVTVLKNEVAKAEASSSQETEMLREALKIAEKADPNNKESVNQAIEFSREAGLEEVPTLKRQDTSRENTGIGILLGGIVLGGTGLSFTRSRKNYLSAIHGLRKGGTKWMMEEMKAKRSSRKTFDRLLKMVKKIY